MEFFDLVICLEDYFRKQQFLQKHQKTSMASLSSQYSPVLARSIYIYMYEDHVYIKMQTHIY